MSPSSTTTPIEARQSAGTWRLSTENVVRQGEANPEHDSLADLQGYVMADRILAVIGASGILPSWKQSNGGNGAEQKDEALLVEEI